MPFLNTIIEYFLFVIFVMDYNNITAEVHPTFTLNLQKRFLLTPDDIF